MVWNPKQDVNEELHFCGSKTQTAKNVTLFLLFNKDSKYMGPYTNGAGYFKVIWQISKACGKAVTDFKVLQFSVRYSFTYIFNSNLPVFKYFSPLTDINHLCKANRMLKIHFSPPPVKL